MKSLTAFILALALALLPFPSPVNAAPLINSYRFGGAPFSPADYSPVQWFSDTGSSAATWPDISGNGRDATQATGGNQPTIVAATLNGKQVRRFNGTSQFLSHTYAITGDSTIYIVVKSTATAVGQGVIYSAAAVSSTLKAFVMSQTSASEFWATYRSGFLNSGQSLRSSYHVIALQTTSAGGIFRHNGTESAYSDSSFYGGDSSDRRVIGQSYGVGSFGDFFQGDIAEIIPYDSAHDATQRANVTNWLAAKYALP